jgi:hypothetical protein
MKLNGWREDGNEQTIPSRPVITHPMVGVKLNRWVTVDALRSLSYQRDEYCMVRPDECEDIRGLCVG